MIAVAVPNCGVQRLGPYELLDELGRGGMGAVYRARKVGEPGRDVALKVLLSPLDTEERVRFDREARVLAGFQHPNVIAVHDAGLTERGLPYLVLPVLPGGSLHDRLRKGGPLPGAEAAAITRKLARAVAYAHERQVLHRDLKPHNVLFDAAGEPVLTDFGLARTRDDRITATGEVLGTPSYMAPEQAQGIRERIGTASDVYGLGATLYAMLSGGPPFVGSSALAVMSKLVTEPPPPLPDTVDPELAAICGRCLAKDPNDRFGQAEDLALALEEWAEEPEAPVEERRLSWVLPTLVVAVGVSAVGMGLAVLWRSGAAVPSRVEVLPTASTAPVAPIPAASPSSTPSPSPSPSPSRPPSPASGPSVAWPPPPPPPPPGPAANAAGAVEKAKALLDKGIRAEKRGELAYAQDLVSASIRVSPSWGAYVVRAGLRRDAKEPTLALADMHTAVKLSPKPAKTRVFLARLLGALGDPVGQLRELERAWIDGPEDVRPSERRLLIRLWMRVGRYAPARRLLERLGARSTEDLELRRLYGECLWRLLDRDEALPVLQAWAKAAGKPDEIQPYERVWERIVALAKMSKLSDLELRAKEAREVAKRDPARALAILETVPPGRRRPQILLLASRYALAAKRVGPAIRYVEEALDICSGAAAAAELAEFGALILLSRRAQDPAAVERANALLNRAIDLNPRSSSLAQRGLLRLKRGHRTEAFVDFRRAAKIGSSTPPAPPVLVGLGWEALQAGKPAAALKHFVDALSSKRRTEEHTFDAKEGAGVALYRLGRQADSQRQLEEVVARFPKQRPVAWAALTAIRVKSGDWAGGIQAQSFAVAQLPLTHPDRPAREMGLRALRVQELLGRVRAARQGNRPKQALAHANAALELQRNADTLTARAIALWDVERRLAAFAEQTAAVELAPTKRPLRRRLARFLKKLEDRPAALRELEAEFQLAPSSFDVERRLALIEELIHAGRRVDALILAERSLGLAPQHPHLQRLIHVNRWWLFLDRPRALGGLARLGAGAGDEAAKARKDYAQLLRLSREIERQQGRQLELKGGALPTSRMVYRLAGTPKEAQEAAWGLALVYVQREEIEEAMRYLSRVIDFGGRLRLPALVFRARFRFYRGHTELAFQDDRRVLEIKPDQPNGRVGRGWEHYVAGRYRQAVAEFTGALPGLKERTRNAREGLAVTYVALGQLKSAALQLEQVLGDSPNLHLACFAKAELLWERGERAAAIKAQEHGLAQFGTPQLRRTHSAWPAQRRALKRMQAELKRKR